MVLVAGSSASDSAVCVKKSDRALVKSSSIVALLIACGSAVSSQSATPAPSSESGQSSSTILLASDFEADDLAPWRSDPLPRMGSQPLSVYTEADGNRCLRADSEADFRAFGVKLADVDRGSIAIAATPWLSWRWQISRALQTADATKKAGDDYAARLYLVFSDSRWNPLAIRTLVYIWDNRQSIGTTLPSTWASKRGRMIVLQSGDTLAGQWTWERRNVHQDFVSAFGYEPAALRAIVLAADTDQTGERVTTLFDDIRLAATVDQQTVDQ
jgi:hypothetical protein